MTPIGAPSDWVSLIDSLVPEILNLVVTTWEGMPPLTTDAREDPTTEMLCRLLRQNKNSSNLPFQIHIQMVELDPAAGQDQGRMDIAFLPITNREEFYFCLECKRLNVVNSGTVRAYSTEYVAHGMTRFVRGQYAPMVRHGGMLGYVLNGDVDRAIQNVSSAIQSRHADLGMVAPGEMDPSSLRPSDSTARETQHARLSGLTPFQIHHMFVPVGPAGVRRPGKKRAKATPSMSLAARVDG